MFDSLLSVFGQSSQGQAAYQQLQAQGYTPQQSAGILTTAFPAAMSAMQNAMMGNGQGGLGLLQITEGHYAQNFLGAAVSGLLRGEGLKGAAIDGLQGVVGGHVAEVIASRCGLPQRIAGVLGAIVTPLMIDWAWEKIQAIQAQSGQTGQSGIGAAFSSLLGGGHAAAPAVAAAPAAAPAAAGFGSSFTPFGR